MSNPSTLTTILTSFFTTDTSTVSVTATTTSTILPPQQSFSSDSLVMSLSELPTTSGDSSTFQPSSPASTQISSLPPAQSTSISPTTFSISVATSTSVIYLTASSPISHQTPTSPFTISNAPSPTVSNAPKAINTGAAIGGSLGGALFVLLLVLVGIFVFNKHHRRQSSVPTAYPSKHIAPELDGGKDAQVFEISAGRIADRHEIGGRARTENQESNPTGTGEGGLPKRGSLEFHPKEMPA